MVLEEVGLENGAALEFKLARPEGLSLRLRSVEVEVEVGEVEVFVECEDEDDV